MEILNFYRIFEKLWQKFRKILGLYISRGREAEPTESREFRKKPSRKNQRKPAIFVNFKGDFAILKKFIEFFAKS